MHDTSRQPFGSMTVTSLSNAVHLAMLPSLCRWREQQVRLHELEDPGGESAACSDGASPLQPGTDDSNCRQAAHAGSITVPPTLPEQPSLREVPAIQAVRPRGSSVLPSSSGMAQGLASTVRSGSNATCNTTAASRDGSSSGQAAAALPPADGLIPLGWGGSSSSSGGGNGYTSSREQWRLVAQQQQQVEDAVAAHMRSYTRHRARLEEEINRKQEVALQLAATAGSACPEGPVAGSGRSSGQPQGARVLLHLTSQHQPSQVATAYTGATASAGWMQQLAPVNKVKEAKQLLLQVRCCTPPQNQQHR